MNTKIGIVLAIIVALGAGAYFYMGGTRPQPVPLQEGAQPNQPSTSNETNTSPQEERAAAKRGSAYVVTWDPAGRTGTAHITFVSVDGPHLENVTYLGQASMSAGSYTWNVPNNLAYSMGSIVIKERNDLNAPAIKEISVRID